MSIVIVKQPESIAAVIGTTVVFAVEATGDGLAYQWQYSGDNGATWWATQLTGNDSAELQVPVTAARNGMMYRCVITDSAGNEAISDSVTLTAEESGDAEDVFQITLQPLSYSGAYGDIAYFSVAAEGSGLTYQWYWRADSNSEWAVNSLTGCKTDTLQVEVLTWRNGFQYRCVITDSAGRQLASAPAEIWGYTACLSSPYFLLPDTWYGRSIVFSAWVRSDDWAAVSDGIAVEICAGKPDMLRRRAWRRKVIGAGGALSNGEYVTGDAPENGKWTRLAVVCELTEEALSGIYDSSATVNENTALSVNVYLNENGGVQLMKPKAEWGNTATDWSPAPEDTDAELGRLTQEVNEAKLMITPEAIIGTVTSSEEFTGLSDTVEEHGSTIAQHADEIALRVKEETFNALGERVDAAEAEIELMPGRIELAVESAYVGGRNYLKASDAYVSSTGYLLATYYFGSELPAAGDEYVIRIWGSRGASDNTTDHFTVDVAHSGGNASLGSATKQDDGTYVLKGEWPALTYPTQLNVYRNLNPVSTSSVIERIMLEVGSVPTDWTPHWEEFKAGSSIELTEDKVNISTPEFNVNIVGSDGETNMLSIDEEGAQMTSLSAPNVAASYDGPSVVYVNASATPNGTYYRSLADVLAALSGKYVGYDVTVNVNAGTTEYGTATLKGTMGGGKITVAAYYGSSSGDARIAGSLVFDHISTPVLLQNLYIDTASGSYGIKALGNSTDITVAMCTMNSTSASGNAGIYVDYGATCYVGASYFYGMAYSMLAKNGGSICAQNCHGNCSMRAERGTIFVTGTAPSAVSTWSTSAYSEYGGKVFYDSGVSVDQGAASSEEPETAPTTATVTAGTVGAYYGSWRSDGVIRQGMYNGNEYAGCMWFTTSTFSGKTIKSATLQLKRLRGSGRSSAVALYLYTTTLTTTSGNPRSSAVSYGKLGEIGNGETKVFTLPKAAAQALASGTAKGLMLYAGDGSQMSGKDYSANYCKIGSSGDELPVLTVNY